MNDKLFQLVGVDSSAEYSEVEQAFETFRSELEKKIAQAPTPALKGKLRNKLREAEDAFADFGNEDEEIPLSTRSTYDEEIPSSGKAASAADNTYAGGDTQSTGGESTRSKLPLHFQGKKLLTTESVSQAFHDDYEAGYDEYISGNLGKWIKNQLLDPYYGRVLTEIDADKTLKDKDQSFALVLLLLDPSNPMMIDGMSFKNLENDNEDIFDQLIRENRKSAQFEASGLGKWTRKITGKADVEQKTQAILEAIEPFDVLYFDDIITKEQLVDVCCNSPSGSKLAGLHWITQTYDEFIERFGWNVIDKTKAISLLQEEREACSLGKRVQEAQELLDGYASVSSPTLKPLIGKTDIDDAEAIAVLAGKGWRTVEELRTKTKLAEQRGKRFKKNFKYVAIFLLLLVIAHVGYQYYIFKNNFSNLIKAENYNNSECYDQNTNSSDCLTVSEAVTVLSTLQISLSCTLVHFSDQQCSNFQKGGISFFSFYKTKYW